MTSADETTHSLLPVTSGESDASIRPLCCASLLRECGRTRRHWYSSPSRANDEQWERLSGLGGGGVHAQGALQERGVKCIQKTLNYDV